MGRRSYFRVTVPLFIITLLQCSASTCSHWCPFSWWRPRPRLARLCLETVLCTMERFIKFYNKRSDTTLWKGVPVAIPVQFLMVLNQSDLRTRTNCCVCVCVYIYILEMHRLTGQWSESDDFLHDRPGSVTGWSVSRLADSKPILLLPAAQAETSQPHAHSQYDITVACKHVVFAWEWFIILIAFSLNGDLCIYVVPDEACTAWVSVWESHYTQSNSQKCIDTCCSRKINKRDLQNMS